MTRKASVPGNGVARPPAKVAQGISTSRLSSQERTTEGAASDCTPMILMEGLMVLAASATPAIRLPPPTGTTMASAAGRSSRISQPTVAAPAISSGSSPSST